MINIYSIHTLIATPCSPATLNVLICRRNCRPTTSDGLRLTPFYTVSDIFSLGSQKQKKHSSMAVRLLDSIGGRTSGCRLSRAGTHHQTQSMRYQHCCRTNTNWKLFLFLYSNNPLSIGTAIVDSPTRQTNERRSDRQKRRLYLSHATFHTLVQCQTTRKNTKIKLVRQCRSCVSPNTHIFNRMHL